MSEIKDLLAILNTIQTGIVIIDRDSRQITDLNPAAEKMIGGKKDDIVGSICHNFICPADKGKCPVTDLGHDVYNSERTLIRVDGDSIPILKTVTPITIKGRSHLLESFVDATQLKIIEKELIEERERFKAVFDFSPLGIAIGNKDGKSIKSNRAFCEFTGYTQEELKNIPFKRLTHPADIDENLILFHEMVDGKRDNYRLQKRFIRKDGLVVWGDLSVVAIRNPEGQYKYNLVIAEDITKKKRAEEELNRNRGRLQDLIENRTKELIKANEDLEREITERRRVEDAMKKSEMFLSTVFYSIKDPFCIIDRDFRILRVNEAYADLKGIGANELIGRKCHLALYDSETLCEDCVVLKTFKSGDPCAKEKKISSAGQDTWLEIYTYPIFDENRGISHVIEYTRNITERKKTETEKELLIHKLEHLSRTDGLTGLLNRRALIEKLEEEFRRVRRYGNGLSLILCDVDFLKDINDTYGHAMGDFVLKSVSKAISASSRDTDLAGRYGGDEFLLILPETNVKGAEEIAERIRKSVKELRFDLNESVKVTLSLGVAGFMPVMQDIDSLIMCADTALYLSKQSGRNRVRTFKAQ